MKIIRVTLYVNFLSCPAQSGIVKLPPNPHSGAPPPPLRTPSVNECLFCVSLDMYLYTELKYLWLFFSRKAFELLYTPVPLCAPQIPRGLACD
jgi:hypothetical protein